MKEAFVLKGKWWTPATPDNVIIGDMNFDPMKGATLNLAGSLREKSECPMPFKIVLGETEDGRAITLVGSNGSWFARPYRITDDGEPGEMTCSAVNANVVLLGGHFPSSDDVQFQRLTIGLSYLSDWVRLNYVPSSVDPEKEDLAVAYETELMGKVNVESEGTASCQLTMDLVEHIGLDRGIETVRQLRNLMALFMHRPTQEVRVWGQAVNGSERPKTVELFYPSFPQDRDPSPLEPEDMLLPLSSVGNDLGRFISNWLKIGSEMAQVLDLYFAASQNDELYPETRFLMYMRAIEAYHRLRYRNYELEPEEHKKRVAIILSSIPEQYREWMREGLEHSNAPSHGQRLKVVFDDHRDIMDLFVEDRKQFVYQLTRTRNHLTHPNGDADEMIFTGNQLTLTSLRLRLLLELCLLRELGIEPDLMRTAVMRNTMFSQIRV